VNKKVKVSYPFFFLKKKKKTLDKYCMLIVDRSMETSNIRYRLIDENFKRSLSID
jgi:hypothetical protein